MNYITTLYNVLYKIGLGLIPIVLLTALIFSFIYLIAKYTGVMLAVSGLFFMCYFAYYLGESMMERK